MQCKNCKGTAFNLEHGQQICAECGLIYEGFIELGNDTDFCDPKSIQYKGLRIIDMTNKEERQRQRDERLKQMRMYS